MAFGLDELRGLPDDELIRLHDQVAVHTVVGTAYYSDELRRRELERSTAASARLARASFWLTVASTLLALVAVLVSVVAIFAPG